MIKNKKVKRFFAIFVLILQFFVSITCVGFAKTNGYCSSFQSSLATSEKQKEIENYEAMATIESSTGRVLYSKNMNKRLAMASTTKIITAIVAIENCDDLDIKYEIPKEAVGIEGSSIYLRTGEHLTIRELLYGLMLRSGNDSAVAIAILVGKTLENFVSMMNNFCLKLNLKDTNIVTVNGLHDDNHYTSAYDLARVSAYALKNKIFAEIVSTKFKTIDNECGGGNKLRYLKNKNKLLTTLCGADGVKTGYTKKAGKCFVGSATREGMQIVCVVLNSASTFDEAKCLIEKAFSEYKLYKLLSSGELTVADVKNGKRKNAPILLKKDINYPLKREEINNVRGFVELNGELIAPLDKDKEIGTIKIELSNDLIFSEKIYTIDVEEKPELRYFIKKIIKSF